MTRSSGWETLDGLVHRVMKKLEKKNVSMAEAFFTDTQTTQVAIRNSEILTRNKTSDAGVGFRIAVERGKTGFGSTNILEEASVMRAAEEALSIAKASSSIETFDLPHPGSMPNVKRLYDPDVEGISVEQAVGAAKAVVEAAEGFDERVNAKDGRVSYSMSHRGIINTLGIDFEEPETKTVIWLWANGEQNGEVTAGCTCANFGRTANLAPEAVGKDGAEMVASLFGARRISTFDGEVVFGPDAVSYQIFDALTDALKGANVMAGRSVWGNKIGQAVASENLVVYDNATLEGGFASRSFDDEGCPSQNTVLIEKGILKSFLHQASSAKALNTQNTGNASRYVGGLDMVRMITGNGYRVKPDIYPSNLMIRPGTRSKDHLISEIDKGVLVESMAGFTQQGSGLISAQLSRAFYVQNGSVRHAIKSGMISGNAFDWLKRVSGIGNDSKRFANSVVPSLRIENVKIVGG